jgi:hypothetical protein
MSAQTQTSMAEHVAQGDRLLTENVYVAVTPEMKQEIVAYAGARSTKLADLVAAVLRGARGEARGSHWALSESSRSPAPVERRGVGRPGLELLDRAGQSSTPVLPGIFYQSQALAAAIVARWLWHI